MTALKPQDEARNLERLAQWIGEGAKEAGARRIGNEHEKFLYRSADRAPLPWRGPPGGGPETGGIADFLEALAADGDGWEVQREEGEPIALLRDDGASLSLEPGGQIELSGAPLGDLHAVHGETQAFLKESGEAAERLRAGFLGMGLLPDRGLDETPKTPKARYRIMRAWMKGAGREGLEMMHRTATVQVNLDFTDERDFTAMSRIGLAFQPVATALFANAPFLDSTPSGWASRRMLVWDRTDPARCAAPDFMFAEGAGYARGPASLWMCRCTSCAARAVR